jgi:hypothetical protein
MRFYKKQIIKPKPGEAKKYIKFAFLPKYISGVIVWLEKYIEIRTYSLEASHTRGSMGGIQYHAGWVVTKKLIDVKNK